MDNLLLLAWRHWRAVSGQRLAAALAFYTLFAVAPLLVVLVSMAGWILGSDRVSAQLQADLITLFGSEAAIEGGLLAIGVGLIVFVVASIQLMNHFRWALQRLWKLHPEPVQNIRAQLLGQLANVTLVVLLGMLLILNMVVGLVLELGQSLLTRHFPWLEPWINWLSFDGLSLLSVWMVALMVVYLPLRRFGLTWRRRLFASGMTALLVMLGNTAIAWYLRVSGTASLFGAAGALVAFLIWIYGTLQIVLFGAVFWYIVAMRQPSTTRSIAGKRIFW